MQSSRKKRISINTDNTFYLVNFEELHTDSKAHQMIMRIWHHLHCFLIIIMKLINLEMAIDFSVHYLEILFALQIIVVQ